jgi:CRISPR-associated protein Cmr2
MAAHCPDWDKRWDNQIECYFSTETALVPLGGSGDEIDRQLAQLLTGKGSFKEAFPDAEAVRELARAIRKDDRPGYDQDHTGRWQYQVELVQRSLAAIRSVRHVPPNHLSRSERWPQKCTLLGSFEQMGPDDLRQSRDFWDQVAAQNGLNVDGVRVRQGEALCAVAMVKRFAGPAFLREQLRLSINDLRFPDTWTIAAAEWLANAEKHGYRLGPAHISPWNGHWLHWAKRDQDLIDADECPAAIFTQIQEARKPDKCGTPPVYYAILKLDGDDLGGWLRGEKSPKVRAVMHPTLVSYYEGLGEQARAGLDAKRPVGPALHATISTALSNFALRAVPAIVRKHHGTTIYSGGDDTLVLLPVSKALTCALELRAAYMSNWWRADRNSGEADRNREYIMMGSRATLSGGLVVVHAKDDLRLALQDARRTEELAKDAGKDALGITIRRRSGEHTSAICRWAFVPTVNNWTEQFRCGASDRWAYHLYMERSTLAHLRVEAMQAEIRRQIMRAEEPTPRLLPPDSIAAAFESFRASFDTPGEALANFLILCHTASFMARGTDQ